MEVDPRQPAKLQKRKSRERQELELAMSGGLSGQPANSSQPMAPASNANAGEDKKKSKFRLSNPFHSKEKEKEREKEKEKDKENNGSKDNSKRNTLDTNGDSAYGSSEPSSSANPSFSSNANPSFSSTANPSFSSHPRPISGEQWHPPPPSVQTHHTTPSLEQNNLAPPAHALQNRSSHENISRETYRDSGTGVTVTTVTTTTTTTTTTTGPGGSTTVEQPIDKNGPSGGSIINTSGPSPPSPMPPLPPSQNPVPGQDSSASHSATNASHNTHAGTSTPPPQGNHDQHHNPLQQGAGHGPTPQIAIPENSSPPIPARNNIRNRLELDSVSPAVQRPNPMDVPISPITPNSPSNNANFSYPSRAPPPGVPRQVPGQSQQPTPQQWGEKWNSQQHGAYDETDRPVPFRAGHANQNDSVQPLQPQPQRQPQKQATLANLKAAAHGIHGAGETLRGTFNDTFDRRFTAADSAVHAKNRATIDAGRSEIEAQQFARRPVPPAHDAPPVPPLPGAQSQTTYQGAPLVGSDSRTGGKLSGFMKKMKEGPMASTRDGSVGTH